MTDPVRAALEDMYAGTPAMGERAAGMRAALRMVCSELDARAERVAPKEKRTNAIDRHVADVLKGLSDHFDAVRSNVHVEVHRDR